MKRFILKAAWAAVCLAAPVPFALSQAQNENEPSILAIADGMKLVNVSAHGSKEIAALNGQVLYGMDEETVAFFQTPAAGFTNASRLLVIDRKTLAIVADKIVKGVQNGFRPSMMKLPFVSRLAVRSKNSTVYIPLFNGQVWNSFDVAEANWKTGEERQLFVPAAKGAERWEISALYSVPMGIVIERGPFLTIFDPATDATVLAVNNAGSDLRPTGNYYVFPGYGLVQSRRAKNMLYHITERDFTTMIPFPAGVRYPDSITNLVKFSRPVAWTIKGRPCLVWGETEAGANSQNRIAQIVVFDLEAKRELLRKPLGAGFSPGFLRDSSGQNIYFFNPEEGEIVRLNLDSQKLSSIAKLGANRLSSIIDID